jgi:hypothetical protein
MGTRQWLIALAVLLAVGMVAQADVGYTIDVTTFYQFGAPPGVSNGISGNPDTGFFTVTNNGTTTFNGTIGDVAVRGSGPDDSFTFGPISLAPGGSLTFGIDDESSNVAGFNGPTGSVQPGVMIQLIGNFNGVEPVSLSVNDADIHSGVPRSANGTVSDSYVLQGGDPFGGDTGDAFEVSQAPGHFEFFEAATVSGVPEPGAFMLLGTALAMLGAGRKLMRKI